MNEANGKKKGFFSRFFSNDKSEDASNGKEYENAFVTIDYPLENEIVKGLHYGVRLGASKDGSVEISINDEEWKPCRFGSGYWWFDWGYFKPGDYKLSARIISPSGEVIVTSKERHCKVC
ncbi:MAG: hypothetical protein LBB93_00865 [Elusimicrobiota bacterium]|nr:hypothetical protein [Elusimicrobiota bacterium]